MYPVGELGLRRGVRGARARGDVEEGTTGLGRDWSSPRVTISDGILLMWFITEHLPMQSPWLLLSISIFTGLASAFKRGAGTESPVCLSFPFCKALLSPVVPETSRCPHPHKRGGCFSGAINPRSSFYLTVELLSLDGHSKHGAHLCKFAHLGSSEPETLLGQSEPL